MPKNQFGDRKWECKQQRLPIGDKKWTDDCPFCPIGSAANGCCKPTTNCNKSRDLYTYRRSSASFVSSAQRYIVWKINSVGDRWVLAILVSLMELMSFTFMLMYTSSGWSERRQLHIYGVAENRPLRVKRVTLEKNEPTFFCVHLFNTWQKLVNLFHIR